MQALDELGSVPFQSSFQRVIERASLRHPEPADQRSLVSSAGSDQCPPDSGELGHGVRPEHCSREPVIQGIEQTVTLPN